MPFQDTDQSPKRVCLGKIVAAHGVKGLVKILPYGDDLSLLEKVEEFKISLKNPIGKYMLAEIEGINDRTQAEKITGTELYLSRDQLPEIEDGFYIADLIGRKACDENGKDMGKVISVENYGASDLLEIQGAQGTFLIPFTDDFVPEISEQTITIKDYEQFL